MLMIIGETIGSQMNHTNTEYLNTRTYWTTEHCTSVLSNKLWNNKYWYKNRINRQKSPLNKYVACTLCWWAEKATLPETNFIYAQLAYVWYSCVFVYDHDAIVVLIFEPYQNNEFRIQMGECHRTHWYLICFIFRIWRHYTRNSYWA